ncbi:MAG: hypothetical protein ACI3V0_09590, partial [Faecousia sp.]
NVYSVGIFDGADATSAGSKNGTDTQKANWFMQNLSDNKGTPQTPSYYLSAADSNTLSNIFKQIADNIESGGSATTLDEKAVIKDIIAPQFTLPEGATTASITLETYQYTGENQWSKNTDSMGAKATINNNQVDVSGFNFSENWCGTETTNGTTTYRGNKLVISFPVEVKDGFLGGNGVYTNTKAGVYENSSSINPVLVFERPQVDVEIKSITVTPEDKNVYLLGDLTADQIKSGATVTVGDVNLNLAADNYGLEPWQYEYVDITVTYKDKDGNTLTNLNDLTDDTTYTVSVEVSPKYDGTVTAKTGEGTGNINVFKPVITFQDTAVAYNEQANFDNAAKTNRNLVSVQWKHGETAADTTTMGEAPALTYAYSSNGTVFTNSEPTLTQETSVKVTVSIGQNDITQYVSFWRNKCEADNGCTFEGGSVSATDNNRVNFIVHIKTFDLTIVKQGVDQADAGAPFVFNIKGGNVDMNVVIYGNGQVTIKNLPAGNYTVEEVGGYWRYDITQAKPGKIQNANAQNNTVTFTNTRTNNQWLDDFASATNKFTGATR